MSGRAAAVWSAFVPVACRNLALSRFPWLRAGLEACGPARRCSRTAAAADACLPRALPRWRPWQAPSALPLDNPLPPRGAPPPVQVRLPLGGPPLGAAAVCHRRGGGGDLGPRAQRAGAVVQLGGRYHHVGWVAGAQAPLWGWREGTRRRPGVRSMQAHAATWTPAFSCALPGGGVRARGPAGCKLLSLA